MTIWISSMECAGIIEAGGVKDVTFALLENFAKTGNSVTLFIPCFKNNSFDLLKNVKRNFLTAEILLCGKTEIVQYSTASFKSFSANVVLIEHSAFFEKEAVYVYTKNEENCNPSHVSGKGHGDMLFLDTLFSKAVAFYAGICKKQDLPDVIHCQDASTALIPCFLPQTEKTKCFVTIHNAGPAYHHEFANVDEAFFYTALPYEKLNEAKNGYRVEPFLLACQNAQLSTVSIFYADELMKPENNAETDGLSSCFFEKNIKIAGITNGIDFLHYLPENKKISRLPFKILDDDFEKGKAKNRTAFLNKIAGQARNDDDNKIVGIGDNDSNSDNDEYLHDLQIFGSLDDGKNGTSGKNENLVYFVYHGRIVSQKGVSLLIDVMKNIFKVAENARLIIMGQGEINIENQAIDFVSQFQGKAVYLKGYNQAMSRLCVTAADFALFPSFFEPCCLEDFISQVFYTIPIANATGGLKKIIDKKTGFLYSPNNFDALKNAIFNAIDFKQNHFDEMQKMVLSMRNYIRENYSWEVVIKKYLEMFEK